MFDNNPKLWVQDSRAKLALFRVGEGFKDNCKYYLPVEV